LVAECFDPGFLRAVGGHGSLYHFLFLLLVVLNLVASFEALGTLMAVGLMMLPAAVARLWAQTLPTMFAIAAVTAVVSGYLGLVASFQFALASGPTIILTASCIYVLSLLISPSGVARRLYSRPHLKA
jgi:zinc/manganese transport system permease protein